MKFLLFYAKGYENRNTVIKAILDEEGISYEEKEDTQKTFMYTQGVSGSAVTYNGKYVGFHYKCIVDYLNANGLMRC